MSSSKCPSPWHMWVQFVHTHPWGGWLGVCQEPAEGWGLAWDNKVLCILMTAGLCWIIVHAAPWWRPGLKGLRSFWVNWAVVPLEGSLGSIYSHMDVAFIDWAQSKTFRPASACWFHWSLNTWVFGNVWIFFRNGETKHPGYSLGLWPFSPFT